VADHASCWPGPVAAFYEGGDAAAQLLPVVGLTAIILGFASINAFTVNRNLMLGRLDDAGTGGTRRSASSSMIVGALILQSVWALVIGGLVGSLVQDRSCRISCCRAPGRASHSNGAPSGAVPFRQVDLPQHDRHFLLRMGTGRSWANTSTLTELAFYNIAFMLATLAHTLKTTLVNRVLYALYCKFMPIRDAAARNKVFRAQILLTGSAFLASAPFIVFGQDIVELLYDPRYYDAGPMVVGIGFAWLFMIITSGHYSSLLAANRSRDFALLLVGSAILRTVFMLLGAVHYRHTGRDRGGACGRACRLPRPGRHDPPQRHLGLAPRCRVRAAGGRSSSPWRCGTHPIPGPSFVALAQTVLTEGSRVDGGPGSARKHALAFGFGQRHRPRLAAQKRAALVAPDESPQFRIVVLLRPGQPGPDEALQRLARPP
jgi:hypothetical protein